MCPSLQRLLKRHMPLTCTSTSRLTAITLATSAVPLPSESCLFLASSPAREVPRRQGQARHLEAAWRQLALAAATCHAVHAKAYEAPPPQRSVPPVMLHATAGAATVTTQTAPPPSHRPTATPQRQLLPPPPHHPTPSHALCRARRCGQCMSLRASPPLPRRRRLRW